MKNRWERWMVMGVVLVAVVWGAGLGGYALKTHLQTEGIHVEGWLSAVAYSAACTTPESRASAMEQRAQERQFVYRLVTAAWANAKPCRVKDTRLVHNLIADAGKTAVRDCFNNNASSACTAKVATFNYHGLGTNTTAAAAGDTGCGTELTTQYNPDSTRASGTQSVPAGNQYRSVGTNTVDASAAVTEWCLMNVNTGAGTLWSHIVFTVINLASGDSLQTTYTLTISKVIEEDLLLVSVGIA